MLMTRQRTYVLTAAAVLLYLLLCWAFADNLFTLSGERRFWNSDAIFSSNVWTYLSLIAIIAAGLYQASRIPEGRVAVAQGQDVLTPGQVEDPRFWRLFTGNVYYALLWMPIRFFAGFEWAEAGEEKIRGGTWKTGEGLLGYWQNAVKVPESGRAPITYGWFRDFLQYMIDHRWYTWFANLVMWGELLVGIGLIVGALVGIAALFGALMNFNYMLAGTTSTNPVLLVLGVGLILGWKVAGFWGLDRWLLKLLGTPWHPGIAFDHQPEPAVRPVRSPRSVAD